MKFFKWGLALIGTLQCFLAFADPIGTFVPLDNSINPVSLSFSPQSVAYSPLFNDNLFAAVGGQNVSSYKIDRTTGEWIFVQATTGDPTIQGVAYSPVVNGKLFAAAVTPTSPASIYLYSVDSLGALTLVDSATNVHNPFSVSFSPLTPEGKLFVAVANQSNSTVGVYSVDTSTGALTFINSYATGSDPRSVAYSPLFDGQLFLATANNGSSTTSVYVVDTNSGELTLVNTYSLGSAATSVAYSPVINGNLFAAVVSYNGTLVYSVDSSTGAFTTVSGSPFASGDYPYSVAYSPILNDALFAAVANRSANTAAIYSVNSSSGVFTQLSTSPVASGNSPRSIAYSPLFGGHLFAAVANHDDPSVSLYSVIIPPSVSQLTPTQGSSLGGTSVIITGNGFDDVTEVFFGTTSASFTRDSSAQITAIAPPGVGTVDVTVVTANGTSPVSPSDQFTYISSGPSITKISPTSGSSFGRTLVTLIGTGFKKVLAVNFGEKPALFYVISDELIEAVSPSGEGKVFVTVITTEGSSEDDEAAIFTYVNPPPSPLDARGCQRVTSCKKRGECAINTLYWTAPTDPSIVRYEIYKDKSLSALIGIVPSFHPTKFKDSSKIGQKKTYYIVSVNAADVKSSPVKIKVKKFCAEVARESHEASHSSSSSSD